MPLGHCPITFHQKDILLAIACAFVLVSCGEKSFGEACALRAGDVVISEIMPHPKTNAGSDRDAEWIELYNATGQGIILDRMRLVRLKYDDATHTVTESGDHYIRFADNIPARGYYVLGGGMQEFVDYRYVDSGDDQTSGEQGENFSTMTNTQGGVALYCGAQLIDRAWYGVLGMGAQVPEGGMSVGVDGGLAPDAMLNDKDAWWCSAGTVAYDSAGNRGSPGLPNVPCGLVQCTHQGQLRNIVVPVVGDLVISEVLLDPTGTSADNGKRNWLEIFVAAKVPVDINRLEVVVTPKGDAKNCNLPAQPASYTFKVPTQTCVQVMPGDYLVLGSTDVQTDNGQLSIDAVAVDLEFGTDFKTCGGALELHRFDIAAGTDAIIDRAVVPRAPSPGVALALDGAAVQLPTPELSNDVPSAFCTTTQTGYYDGVGTPGSANAYCGTVGCVAGGGGGILRPVQVPSVGDVVISEVLGGVSGSDCNREWVEVYVRQGPVDLNGVVLSTPRTSGRTSYNTVTFQGASCGLDCYACVTGDTGDFVAIQIAYVGASGCENPKNDPIANPDGIAETTKTGIFIQSDDLDVALLVNDVVVDEAWVPIGSDNKSQQLSPQWLTPTGNDTTANFCQATQSIGFFGLGSPGVANEVCL